MVRVGYQRHFCHDWWTLLLLRSRFVKQHYILIRHSNPIKIRPCSQNYVRCRYGRSRSTPLQAGHRDTRHRCHAPARIMEQLI